MEYHQFRRRFGEIIRSIRKEKDITQEDLAELVDKSTEHISYIERGERSPSFELLLDLSRVLDVSLSNLLNIAQEDDENKLPEEILLNSVPAPLHVDALPKEVKEPIKPEEKRKLDLTRLQEGFDGVQLLQKLAEEYGINDVFQDNGGKVLQLLIILGLKQITAEKGKGARREGNDAVDEQGNEYELKTINIAPRNNNPTDRNLNVSTHHHLNTIILDKYRKVEAWYFGIYINIELAEIWKVHPSVLEPLFSHWENKIREEGQQLNNPKIPLRIVRTSGQLIYPEETVLDDIFAPRQKRITKAKPTDPKEI